MSYFDIDPRASDDLLERARQNPATVPTASTFDGAATATGKGLLQGIVAQPALLLGDAVTPTLRPVAKSIDEMFGGSNVSDWLERERQKNVAAVVGLMPDADTGLAGNLGYGLTSVLPGAVAGSVAGGPAGGAAVAGALQGYSSMRVAQSKGVDDLTAMGQGLIEGGAMAAGVALPMSVGAKVLPSIALGVGGNVGLGVVSRGGVGTLLERRGYADMAKQYQAFDTEAMLVDGVLGAAFGTLGAKMARVEVATSTVDAALATNNKLHTQVDAAPGVPADPMSQTAHGKALDTAMHDLAQDRPVDVSDTGVADAEFLPVRADVRAAVKVAMEDLQPLGRALDSVDELRARAEALGLEAPDSPILTGRRLEANGVDPSPAPVGPVGRRAEVFMGERSEPVRFEVVEADSVAPSIGKADNQFRDRTRAASQLQISKIAQNLQFGRLGDSPSMTDGAPTLAQDGRIIGGNGRVAAVQQAYERGLAQDYRTQLEARAPEFGLTAEQVQGMNQPVLVRRFENAVNVREAAILSNEGGGMRMSGLEQSKVDAERMPTLREVDIPESGDLNATSIREFILNWMSKMPTDEQAAMIDAEGKLSAEGLLRARNGLLFKAYGDSPTLARLVESTDDAQKNVANALVKAAARVAEARDMIAAGDLHDLDIQPQLLQAVEKFDDLRASGQTVEKFLAQGDMFGQGVGGEAVALMRFMEQNKRSSKALAEAVTRYYEAVQAAGNPRQASMLDSGPPSRAEILTAVLKGVAATDPMAIRQAMRAQAPEMQRLPATGRTELLDLYARAEAEKPAFDKQVADLAAEFEGQAKLADLKGVDRTVDKIVADYAGNVAGMKDILRATIVVDSAAKVNEVVARIEAEFKTVGETRNLFADGAPSMGGYRDGKINVQRGDMVAEIQVNTPEMMAAKDQAHGFYKEQHTLERAYQGKAMPAEVSAKLDELIAKQAEIYDAAWTASTRALNLSSDTGVPLRRAESAGKTRGGSTSQATENGTSSQSGLSDTGIPSTSKSSALGPKAGNDFIGTSDVSITDGAKNATSEQVAQVLDDQPNAQVVTETGEIQFAGLALAESDVKIATTEKDANGYDAAVACALRG